MSRSIYEISASMQEVRRAIESEEGWTDEDKDMALESYFESTEEELEAKGDSYAAVIIEKKSQAEMFKAEAKRLSEMARREEAEIERMKDRLEWFIRQNGWTSMPSRLHKIRLVGNGGLRPLVITQPDLSLIPDEYTWTVIQTNNDAIRKDLDEGKELPFAHLGERGISLRID